MSKQNVDEKKRDAVLKALLARNENKVCFDCPNRNPVWSTPTYGAFVCHQCTAIHRKVGVHISFVRSTELDQWAVEDLAKVIVGGNNKARQFFRNNGSSELEGTEKYLSETAERYRDELESTIHKTDGLLGSIRNGSLDSVLDFVESFDTQTKSTNTSNVSTNSKVINSKSTVDTGKKVGVKNISNDFFADFDKSSEESKEDEPQIDRNVDKKQPSRLNYDEPKDKNKPIAREDNPKAMQKKQGAHSHNIFGDDEEDTRGKKKNNDDFRDDEYFGNDRDNRNNKYRNGDEDRYNNRRDYDDNKFSRGNNSSFSRGDDYDDKFSRGNDRGYDDNKFSRGNNRGGDDDYNFSRRGNDDNKFSRGNDRGYDDNKFSRGNNDNKFSRGNDRDYDDNKFSRGNDRGYDDNKFSRGNDRGYDDNKFSRGNDRGYDDNKFSRGNTDKGKEGNLKDYSGQKSISSNQFFGRGFDHRGDGGDDISMKMSFGNSNSISSDTLYGKKEGGSSGSKNKSNSDYDDLMQRFKDTASNDLSSLKENISDGAQKLVQIYKNFVGDN